LNTLVLLDLAPSALTASWMSCGPPLFTSWALPGAVATLALPSARSTCSTSAAVSFTEKKDWLTRMLSGRGMQPSVLPLWRAGVSRPEPGHDGVVTCTMRPLPSASQASTPLECPHGAEHESLQPGMTGSL